MSVVSVRFGTDKLLEETLHNNFIAEVWVEHGAMRRHQLTGFVF